MLQKLRDKIDTILGPVVQVIEPDTHKLPYLQAVVKETLRLRMAIPLLVPQMNLHDAKLAGYDIPAESKILVNVWWLANNPGRRSKRVGMNSGITLGRMVQNFELLRPNGQSKIDTTEKGGQFSLHILKHSTIVAKPRVF
ncbi:hypothetical protein V6N11_070085 [Hibiscus sabdariffa]|uniref:Trans-cinnamate 4-monooxygenase n=1 Tax=Hibiscus sabdariffa TaxID=183260 RepID=A0ABR2QDZ8_9ROSI